MRKDLFLFKSIALASIFLLGANSCVFNEESDPSVRVTSIVIMSSLVEKQPAEAETGNNKYVFYVYPDATEGDIKTFAPVITVSSGCVVTPESKTPQDFTNGPVTYTIKHTRTGLTSTFTLECIRGLYKDAKMLSISIDYDKVVKQPEVPAVGNKIDFAVSAEATLEELKALVPVITVSPGATVNPASGVACDFSEGPVKFTVTAENGDQNEYIVECTRIMYADAVIKSITFADPNGIILKQPEVIEGESVLTVYVKPESTPEQIAALVPNITVSPGATVSPASGVAAGLVAGNLTKAGTPVQYTVTSEDGTDKNTYEVFCAAMKIVYDFEEWAIDDPKAKPNLQYFDTPGWGNSNGGVKSIKDMFPQFYSGEFGIKPTNDKYNGTYAAELVTLNTTGGSVLGGAFRIPKITSGSLFTGYFKTEILDQLKSTKFGNEMPHKPTKVVLYYKYSPGQTFFRCADPKKSNETVEEPGTIDECAVSLVMYEVSSFSDVNQYLTGKDIYTSTRIIGSAAWSGGAKADFTRLELDLVYTKTYDPNKLYRFAVITSSSKEGMTFSGAPGSRLVIDDVEIYCE